MSAAIDGERLVQILEAEAEYWLATPRGNDPDSFHYYAAPLLLRLATAIKDAS